MRMAIHLSIAQERYPPVTHSKLEFAIIHLLKLFEIASVLVLTSRDRANTICFTTREASTKCIWLIRRSCEAVGPCWYKRYACIDQLGTLVGNLQLYFLKSAYSSPSNRRNPNRPSRKCSDFKTYFYFVLFTLSPGREYIDGPNFQFRRWQQSSRGGA
jgi:hypothetical protein